MAKFTKKLDKKKKASTDNTVKEQCESKVPRSLRAHVFKPGVSPNPAGRPKGSRNKLGEAFLSAMLEDFEEYGAVAIADCRHEDPARYCAIIASIIPKDINADSEERILEKFLDQFTSVEEIREFRALLATTLRDGQSLAEEGNTVITRRKSNRVQQVLLPGQG